MRIGVYADPHITRNMRNQQDLWETSLIDSFSNMYNCFREEKVDRIICLGDFFDRAVLQAKDYHLVNRILEIIQGSESDSIETYFLLGNHEIDDNNQNILLFLEQLRNIHPVVNLFEDNNLLFIPYNVDPLNLDCKLFKDKVIFTHCDIYGSALAGGITKAFFGINPRLFSESIVVFNGHVHLHSVNDKVINVGSLLVSRFGELRLGEYPKYYIYDTDTNEIRTFENEYSLIYVTVNQDNIEEIKTYKNLKRVNISYEYAEDEPPKIDTEFNSIRYIKLVSNKGESLEKGTHKNEKSIIDIPQIISEHIKNDLNVSEDNKSKYIKTSLEVLS